MPTYEKRPAGWTVRFTVKDGDGNDHRKRLSGFQTKKKAELAMIDFVSTYETPAPTKDDSITFDEILSYWLSWEKGRVKSSSFADVSSRVENHILPFFTGMKVNDITPAVVLKWQSSVSEYSHGYKNALRSVLSSILKFGHKYYQTENPMPDTDGFRNTDSKKEMLFWTPEEFSQFISVVDDEKYRLLFRTLYICGCRKGEALALTWDDIDQGKRTIRINKNATNKGSEKGMTITTPKNNSSNRIIPIPEHLCADLLAFRGSSTGTQFIFGSDSPLSFNSVDHAFSKYIKLSGVKGIRIHDLRHSCASLLISQGVSIVGVSKRLGHTNTEQTLNTYAHLLPSDSDLILSVFQNF